MLWSNLRPLIPSVEAFRGATDVNIIAVSSVTTTIPVDTPATGIIFVVSADGSEIGYTYSSWSGQSFTTTIPVSTYTGGTQFAYVPYLYAEATTTSVTETTTIYVSDRAVIARVRKAGIIPFQTVGTYNATGYTAAAIRTTDSIVV